MAKAPEQWSITKGISTGSCGMGRGEIGAGSFLLLLGIVAPGWVLLSS